MPDYVIEELDLFELPEQIEEIQILELPNKPKDNDAYQAWTVCDCGYIGDAWWVWKPKDDYFEYYCPECKNLIKDVTPEVFGEMNEPCTK